MGQKRQIAAPNLGAAREADKSQATGTRPRLTPCAGIFFGRVTPSAFFTMKRDPKVISMTRLFPSGAWECSTIHKGYLTRRVYYFYTKREARAAFLSELKAL